MSQILRSRITGTGMYVPPRVVTNFDLEKMMDTSDAWIRERTGIVERRWVEPGIGSAELGEYAAQQALENAGRKPQDVDFIIFATLSPEYQFPGSGVVLQKRLGIPGIGALDIRCQCTGFVYGLSIADQYIKSGMYKCVLVVGAEVQSTCLDKTTRGRDMAVLFGDGAGAAVVEPSEDSSRGIYSSHLHADGRYARELWCEHPSPLNEPAIIQEMLQDDSLYPHMDGRQVFKHAVVKFISAINEALMANGMAVDDVKLIIPHQANQRITEAVAERVGGMEKVYSNIAKYGNTTAASIPIALHEALSEGRIKSGDFVILVAFGSGLTWGSVMLKW